MQTVKIGKTTYQVIERSDYQASGFDYVKLTLLKGKTEKSLIYNVTLNDWTLWSGRVGMPKNVDPELSFNLFEEAEEEAQPQTHPASPRLVSNAELADLPQTWGNATVDTSKYYVSALKAWQVNEVTYEEGVAAGMLCQQYNGGFYLGQ